MIKINNLSRSFGSLKAVDEISFSIRDKEIVGFLGPNGAGKTTTLRMLVGYLQPSSGSIELDGKNIFDDPLVYSRQIGYLPEHNPLYDEMTVDEALAYFAALRDMNKQAFKQRRAFVIQNCGLGEVIRQRIGTLSKGYRQRTGLALAILHDPRILILDEPTSGLDPNQIIEIRELIRQLGQEKMVILSSHIMQEVQALCDRVVIINKGKIIVDDSKDKLGSYLNTSDMLYVEVEGTNIDFVGFCGEYPAVELSIIGNDNKHCKLRVSMPSDSSLRQDLARYISDKGWLILEMRTEKQTLEQIFHELTGDTGAVYSPATDNEDEISREEA